MPDGVQQAVPTDRCPTTRWSLVRRARAEGVDGSRAALGELLRRYLPALRAHLLYRGRATADEVDDLVQGFVASRVLERDLLGSADRSKGKFRTLLLTALDRYAVSRHRHDTAARRSPGNDSRPVNIEAAEGVSAGSGGADPFEVAWAREVLSQALQRMRRECARTSRPLLWQVFDGRILRPAAEGTPPIGYEHLVREFHFDSPAHARNALITSRRMFARMLREVVGEYTGDEEGAAEEEIRDLRRVLSGGVPADSVGLGA